MYTVEITVNLAPSTRHFDVSFLLKLLFVYREIITLHKKVCYGAYSTHNVSICTTLICTYAYIYKCIHTYCIYACMHACMVKFRKVT